MRMLDAVVPVCKRITFRFFLHSFCSENFILEEKHAIFDVFNASNYINARIVCMFMNGTHVPSLYISLSLFSFLTIVDYLARSLSPPLSLADLIVALHFLLVCRSSSFPPQSHIHIFTHLCTLSHKWQ